MASKKTLTNLTNHDIISDLPDAILTHILSFLPTKDSVLTRILSTRWKKLFTLVPVLDFEYNCLTSRSPDSITNFIHLVNFVFILNNVSSVTKFRFHFSNLSYPLEPCNIFAWIYSIVHRDVKQIDISVRASLPLTLPCDLFSSKTLTKLNLWGHFNIVMPREVCLPCLRTCNLGLVYFNSESARRLFQSCPSLERLDLTSCFMDGVEVLNISSSTLKCFKIYVCECEEIFQFVLNVPNLEYFEYGGDGLVENEFVGLETLKSIVKATLYYDQKLAIKDDVSVQLVQAICHVSELGLFCGPMEAFVRSSQPWPKFSNLTRLIFGPISSLSSSLLASLLDNSPRLEFLSFFQFQQEIEDEDDEDNQESYLLPNHVPECLSLHLKEVNFRCFTMMDYECRLIKFLLKYAKNLEKMHICSAIKWNERFEISSPKCEVVFDSVGFYDRKC